MKSIFKIFILLSVISCTDTNVRPINRYSVAIVNQSSSSLSVLGFNSNNDAVFNYVINTMMVGGNCNTTGEFFPGYACGADSIVFKFGNGKGYACAPRITNTASLCWEEKSPFGNGEFFVSSDGRNFNFIITEEDFQNANDLPD